MKWNNQKFTHSIEAQIPQYDLNQQRKPSKREKKKTKQTKKTKLKLFETDGNYNINSCGKEYLITSCSIRDNPYCWVFSNPITFFIQFLSYCAFFLDIHTAISGWMRHHLSRIFLQAFQLFMDKKRPKKTLPPSPWEDISWRRIPCLRQASNKHSITGLLSIQKKSL